MAPVLETMIAFLISMMTYPNKMAVQFKTQGSYNILKWLLRGSAFYSSYPMKGK